MVSTVNSLFRYYVAQVISVSFNLWQDVLSSLKKVWKSTSIFDKSVIRESLLWYNPMFRLQFRKERKDEGMMVISDLLYYLTVPLSLEKNHNKCDIKNIFLEYGKIAAILKKHFEWKEIPDCRKPYPRNSFLNTILAVDKRGVSNLYRTLQHEGNHVLGEINSKWEEKTLLSFSSIDISRSFVFHHSLYKDCYLKYMRFRTLHKRFYTNEKLFKMGIKNCDKCTFCKSVINSVEHVLFKGYVNSRIVGKNQSMVRRDRIYRL